jgi:hypothetical protein
MRLRLRDIWMLFGVAAQQFVEQLLLHVDSRIEFRIGAHLRERTPNPAAGSAPHQPVPA